MDTLIINKRHELPFRKKFLWDIVTVLLWIGWIYLWKPIILVIYKIVTLKAEPHELWNVILSEVSVIPFHHAMMMLVFTPIILFILSRLNRHQAPTVHLVYDTDDYARYFDLNEEELAEGIANQLVTVFHDDHGKITKIEKIE